MEKDPIFFETQIRIVLDISGRSNVLDISEAQVSTYFWQGQWAELHFRSMWS